MVERDRIELSQAQGFNLPLYQLSYRSKFILEEGVGFKPTKDTANAFACFQDRCIQSLYQPSKLCCYKLLVRICTLHELTTRFSLPDVSDYTGSYLISVYLFRHSSLHYFLGYGGRTRTCECRSQSPMCLPTSPRRIIIKGEHSTETCSPNYMNHRKDSVKTGA